MVGRRPSAPGTKRKSECSPFDSECKKKLRISSFYKPKKKKKGKPPEFTGGTGGETPVKKPEPKKEEDRDVSYAVTYPGGETRLKTEPRDKSITLAEQIRRARARALKQR